MKARERRLLLATLLPALLLATWVALAAALLTITMEPDRRAALGELIAPQGAFIFLAWAVAAALLGWLSRGWYLRHTIAPQRLLERAQALVAGADARELVDEEVGAANSEAVIGMARLIDRQRAEAQRLDREMADEVAAASRKIDEERSRLAALMSELTQAVVVCNMQGVVLLYNGRARLAFRALSQAPQLADGAELVGLGRSIYTVFDRKLVEHALARVEALLREGRADPGAQFVTATPSGQLMRAQMAPVRASGQADDAGAAWEPPAINGFVLMLENVTREFEEETLRDKLLIGLTEGSRASLANMQAATEMLDFPDMDAPMRERFHNVIREEVASMSQRIKALAHTTLQSVKTRWPLEDMRGADLVAASAQRIGALLHRPVTLLEVDAALWLKVDSFSMLFALDYLAGRLIDELQVNALQLRLGPAGQRAQLDLVWPGPSISTETVMGWQMDSMRVGAERSPLSLRDVLERHDGECWFERDRPRQQAFFRFLLPLAETGAAAADLGLRAGDARPEYYDFDLFASTSQTLEWADRPLAELTYTVFDTETTGLNPTEGDEIIQIGAARIVNGKLLVHESFEQLIDPGRDVPEAGIAVHGIRPEMVAGKPTISQVLPAFHTFAAGSVLVAHNAAFDMRFLQLKEQQAGVRFDQPVLDTLLLSAVAQPQQESHALEAIAERVGVALEGRHSALGDALATARVFLKLVALLEGRGIVTLGQAIDAAQKTWYARLKY